MFVNERVFIKTENMTPKKLIELTRKFGDRITVVYSADDDGFLITSTDTRVSGDDILTFLE
jgi:hypothetical protein